MEEEYELEAVLFGVRVLWNSLPTNMYKQFLAQKDGKLQVRHGRYWEFPMAITAKANTTIITIIATMKFSRMEPPIIYNTLSIHGYLVTSICMWSHL